MALRKYNDLSQNIEILSEQVVDSIFEVHKTIGPGFLEQIYEDCLCEKLMLRDISYQRQKPLEIFYKNKKMKTAYRLDLVVEDKIIIELKCAEKLIPVHKAQIMSYLKMSGLKLGFLMNFNSVLMKDGLQRIVLQKTS